MEEEIQIKVLQNEAIYPPNEFYTQNDKHNSYSNTDALYRFFLLPKI